MSREEYEDIKEEWMSWSASIEEMTIEINKAVENVGYGEFYDVLKVGRLQKVDRMLMNALKYLETGEWVI